MDENQRKAIQKEVELLPNLSFEEQKFSKKLTRALFADLLNQWLYKEDQQTEYDLQNPRILNVDKMVVALIRRAQMGDAIAIKLILDKVTGPEPKDILKDYPSLRDMTTQERIGLIKELHDARKRLGSKP